MSVVSAIGSPRNPKVKGSLIDRLTIETPNRRRAAKPASIASGRSAGAARLPLPRFFGRRGRTARHRYR